MNKKPYLLKEISHKHNLPLHQVSSIVHDFFDQVTKSLIEQHEVSVLGFGKFLPMTIKAHQGINPRTQEKVKVPEKRKIKFKMASHLKTSLNLFKK